MRFTGLAITAVFTVAIMSANIEAQRSGKICGDPNSACAGREQFQPWELTFALPKNAVIYESEFFYSVILKSLKLKNTDDCQNAVSEDERLATQDLFPRNKVFALKCFDPGDMYYTNVADNVSFLGVFAGRTRAQADAFLKTVKASGKFPGATLRRMKAAINGT